MANLKKIGIYIQVNDLYRRAPGAPPFREKPLDLVIRSVSPKEISLLTPLENKDDRVFLIRLEDYGDECRGIFFEGEPIGYVWLSDSVMRIPELEYQRPLAPNEVYMYDVFIGEGWRNRGFYSIFLGDLFGRLFPLGKSVYTSVEITNRRAHQANVKMGFRKIGKGYRIKLGNRCIRSSISISQTGTDEIPN